MMEPPNNYATESNNEEEIRNNRPLNPYFIPVVYPPVDLPENSIDNLAVEQIFGPVFRPDKHKRKKKHIPRFPPGISPFGDERDPGADPASYPPEARKPATEFRKQLRGNFYKHGSALFDKYAQPMWKIVPRMPIILKAVVKASGIAIAVVASPIYFWVACVESWRHYNGWLYYVWFYIAGTQGYYQRQQECSRVLKEGPNRRFTVTSQFWHRRGCEGSFAESRAQVTLMDIVNTAPFILVNNG